MFIIFPFLICCGFNVSSPGLWIIYPHDLYHRRLATWSQMHYVYIWIEVIIFNASIVQTKIEEDFFHRFSRFKYNLYWWREFKEIWLLFSQSYFRYVDLIIILLSTSCYRYHKVESYSQTIIFYMLAAAISTDNNNNSINRFGHNFPLFLWKNGLS